MAWWLVVGSGRRGPGAGVASATSSRGQGGGRSTRPATPSLARMLETCTPAVLRLKNNASVIWRLLRPLATRQAPPGPAGSGRAGGGQADGQQRRLRQSTWHRGRRRRSGSRPGRRAARRGWVPRRSTQAAGEQAPLSSITMAHHWFIRLLRCLLRSRRRRLQPPAWGERSRTGVSGLACRAGGRPPAGRTG
jgi:hypothetical protein